MKKLIISLVLAALASLGLVGTTANAASATTCPYSGCVSTKTTLGHPKSVQSGGYINFKIRVTPVSGTGHPRGTVTLTCTGPGKTHSKTRAYNGYPRSIVMRFSNPGKWSCKVHFSSTSKWTKSASAGSFKVYRG